MIMLLVMLAYFIVYSFSALFFASYLRSCNIWWFMSAWFIVNATDCHSTICFLRVNLQEANPTARLFIRLLGTFWGPIVGKTIRPIA